MLQTGFIPGGDWYRGFIRSNRKIGIRLWNRISVLKPSPTRCSTQSREWRDAIPGDLEIHGTSKDLIRETSRKMVSMNNRCATSLKRLLQARPFQSRGNHLLRIIIESRFIIPASVQASEPTSGCFIERSIGSWNHIALKSSRLNADISENF